MIEEKEIKLFQISLEDKPNLKRLINTSPEQFQEVLVPLLQLAERIAGSNANDLSKAVFNQPASSILTTMLDAFFDYRGITSHHPIDGEADALTVLQHENNPLSIFTGKAAAYNGLGQQITAEEFHKNADNFKDWFQGLLYAARYIDHESYVKYLTLDRFDLIEGMKYENVEKLISIQPALNYQREHDIVVGQLIPGTGYFDLGDAATKKLDRCPACQSTEWDVTNDSYAYCPECKGGGLK